MLLASANYCTAVSGGAGRPVRVKTGCLTNVLGESALPQRTDINRRDFRGRNGQYRHGERTKAAIAEQRKFSALLKLLRAGLA
jgi:hypothetical protein